MEKNKIELVETHQLVGNDHRNFEHMKKTNICFCQENLRKWANKYIDTQTFLTILRY